MVAAPYIQAALASEAVLGATGQKLTKEFLQEAVINTILALGDVSPSSLSKEAFEGMLSDRIFGALGTRLKLAGKVFDKVKDWHTLGFGSNVKTTWEGIKASTVKAAQTAGAVHLPKIRRRHSR